MLPFPALSDYSCPHRPVSGAGGQPSVPGAAQADDDIVISGTKEENTVLDADIMVKKHTLVMNPGGHFASPDKRIARGVCWMLENDRI